MLVLSRRVGEAILIGSPPNQVTVQLIGIGYGRVRLGIEGHPSIPIMRRELLGPLCEWCKCEIQGEPINYGPHEYCSLQCSYDAKNHYDVDDQMRDERRR